MKQEVKKALKVINQLCKASMIEDYAIGGGIAALFYIEPFLTYDLDVFIIPTKKEKKLILLTPIFEYLNKKGYQWKGEHIIIEGTPVQFIPVDELENEAVKYAKEIRYQGIKTKVITPEYLIAILLRANRKKDIEKIERLLKHTKIDKKRLKEILLHYGLFKKLKKL